MNAFIKEMLMKHDIKAQAEQIKILKKYEKHCQKMANQRRQHNRPTTWDNNRWGAQSTRREVSKNNRYTGLARQFIRGKNYWTVENSTKHNNQVKVQELHSKLSEWGIKVNNFEIEWWLNPVNR